MKWRLLKKNSCEQFNRGQCSGEGTQWQIKGRGMGGLGQGLFLISGKNRRNHWQKEDKQAGQAKNTPSLSPVQALDGHWHLPPTDATWSWFWPCVLCGLHLLQVLALLQGSSAAFFGFHLSTKTNISKFQFDQNRRPAWKPAKMYLLIIPNFAW